MKARVKLVEGVTLLAESDSGHGVVMDGAPEIGGRNLGPRPMELVLLGLGGCTAMDVLSILRKGRHSVVDCQIHLEAQRAESVPKVFTRIHLRYQVFGRGIPLPAVARAVSLSAEKYCSVSLMLGHSVEITHSVESIEVD